MNTLKTDEEKFVEWLKPSEKIAKFFIVKNPTELGRTEVSWDGVVVDSWLKRKVRTLFRIGKNRYLHILQYFD